MTFCLSACLLTVYAADEARVDFDMKKNLFREGVNMCGRPYKWPCYHKIPNQFEGEEISIRENNVKDPLVFSVKREGIVTIVTDPAGVMYLKSQGWEKVDTAEIIWFTGEIHELIIMQKKLPKGDYSLKCKGLSGIRIIDN
jgi:hypothetical protein